MISASGFLFIKTTIIITLSLYNHPRKYKLLYNTRTSSFSYYNIFIPDFFAKKNYWWYIDFGSNFY